MDEQTVFTEALAKETPRERAIYLDGICGQGSALRARVEELLEVHGRSDDFLQDPVVSKATLRPEAVETTGTQIGPYKLCEQIGEGGMGAVYMATQKEPVRRDVALKIIKAGMDTREVIARFGAERQALALMNHPHIAKVLDAGATESGRPYFAMELVRGIPITDYCDRHQLDLTQRLELFTTVCRAVQHAHQKGIIHRDLKPSNVLVELHDVQPVPKVIDFGVAKATNQQLTEETFHTGFDRMIGTPLYMSPEQAVLSGLDVDTRSDVYSLGVLLYELLTATTPFESEHLKQAGYDEMRRIIREDEPPRPSERISTLSAAAISTVSDRKHTDPHKLSLVVRGELDWIVMKALEKDRTRRYESANAFAADIQRYLDDEVVEACPPSAAYRFRKLARRNKAAMVTATVVTVALALGILGTTWQAVRVTQALDEKEGVVQEKEEALVAAKEERERAVKAERTAQLDREIAEENFRRARDAVDKYLTNVSENKLLNVPAMQPLRKDLLQLALDYHKQFIAERGDDLALRVEVATSHYRFAGIAKVLGDRMEARNAHNKALEMRKSLATKNPKNANMQHALAQSYISVGLIQTTHADAIVYQTKAIEAAKPLVDPEHRATLATAYIHLGALKERQFRNYGGNQKMDEARAALENAAEILETLKEEHPRELQPNLVLVYNELGAWHQVMGHQDEVAGFLQRALEVSKELAAEDSDNLEYQSSLAGCYWNAGEHEKSIEIFKKLADQNPLVPGFQASLATAYANLGQIRKVPGKLEQSIEIYKRLARDYPTDNNFAGSVGATYQSLGDVLLAARRNDEAIAAYKSAIAVLSKLTYFQMELSDAYKGLSRAQDKAGRLDEAIAAQRSSLEVSQEILERTSDQLHFRTSHAYHRKHLGTLLRRKGRVDEALAAHRSAVELLRTAFADGESPSGSPGQVLAAMRLLVNLHRDLANFLKDLNRHDEAAKSYHNAVKLAGEVIELNPTDAEAWRFRGRLHFDLQEDDKALTDLSKAIELDPKMDTAFKERSWLLRRMQQFDRALADATAAIALRPSLRSLYFERASIYRDLEQFELALLDCQQAIDIDPEQDAPWFTRASAYALRGDIYAENLRHYNDAVIEYSKALELEPYNTVYLQRRGKAFQELGDSERATADFEDAARNSMKAGTQL